MSQEFKSTHTQRHELNVSLRGKLSADYLKLRNTDEAAASRWIRKLIKHAGEGHPQLMHRMEADLHGEQRVVIGLRSEVGRYADW